MEAWTKALDDGYGIDVIFLGYRKAFDSVPHTLLIEKLKSHGISGPVLIWTENFLKSRRKMQAWGQRKFLTLGHSSERSTSRISPGSTSVLTLR